VAASDVKHKIEDALKRSAENPFLKARGTRGEN
jgi:hypothetical protein